MREPAILMVVCGLKFVSLVVNLGARVVNDVKGSGALCGVAGRDMGARRTRSEYVQGSVVIDTGLPVRT